MADDGPLVPPRPDPHDPGMEARVAKLEEAIVEIRTDFKAMRQEVALLVAGLNSLRQDVAKLTHDVSKLTQDVAKLTIDLARIDGRVSQMPTLIQLVTVVIAIWGMAFAALRFAGH
jgi:septal ring factor EnvC (AmiA/AmiB activator)